MKKYCELAHTFSNYKKENQLVAALLGLNGEAGEAAEKLKKLIRDNDFEITAEFQKNLALELGDVLWYVNEVGNAIGYSLEDIAKMNIKKLNSRKERNVLSGSGDHR